MILLKTIKIGFGISVDDDIDKLLLAIRSILFDRDKFLQKI